jgi:electron transport complex protein RnfG
MSDAVRYPLVLGIIAVASAAVLGVTYGTTREQIKYQALLDRNRALVAVLGIKVDDPESPPWTVTEHVDSSGKLGEFTVFQATDPETGKTLYATLGVGQGYSSKVRVMVAVDDAIKRGMAETVVRAVKVVQQLETPGLGSKCQNADFQAQFERLPLRLLAIDRAMTGYRDPAAEGEQQIAAITGATITTNAVVAGIRQAVARIDFHIQEQEAGE